MDRKAAPAGEAWLSSTHARRPPARLRVGLGERLVRRPHNQSPAVLGFNGRTSDAAAIARMQQIEADDLVAAVEFIGPIARLRSGVVLTPLRHSPALEGRSLAAGTAVHKPVKSAGSMVPRRAGIAEFGCETEKKPAGGGQRAEVLGGSTRRTMLQLRFRIVSCNPSSGADKRRSISDSDAARLFSDEALGPDLSQMGDWTVNFDVAGRPRRI